MRFHIALLMLLAPIASGLAEQTKTVRVSLKFHQRPDQTDNELLAQELRRHGLTQPGKNMNPNTRVFTWPAEAFQEGQDLGKQLEIAEKVCQAVEELSIPALEDCSYAGGAVPELFENKSATTTLSSYGRLPKTDPYFAELDSVADKIKAFYRYWTGDNSVALKCLDRVWASSVGSSGQLEGTNLILLKVMATSKNWDIRKDSTKEALKLGGNEKGAAVIRCLARDMHYMVRLEAGEAAIKLKGDERMAILRYLAKDKSRSVRRSVAWDTYKLDNNDMAMTLLKELANDKDDFVLDGVIRSSLRLGDDDKTAFILKTIVKNELGKDAASSIESSGREAVFPALMLLLRYSSNHHIRRYTLSHSIAFLNLDVDQNTSMLKVAAKDRNEHIRKDAASNMRYWKGNEREKIAILKDLMKDKSEHVRFCVISIAGDLDNRAAAMAILDHLAQDPVGWIKYEVIEEAIYLGNPAEAMAILGRLVQDKNEEISRKALQALLKPYSFH